MVIILATQLDELALQTSNSLKHGESVFILPVHVIASATPGSQERLKINMTKTDEK